MFKGMHWPDFNVIVPQRRGRPQEGERRGSSEVVKTLTMLIPFAVMGRPFTGGPQTMAK